jgi:uncharacterized protein
MRSLFVAAVAAAALFAEPARAASMFECAGPSTIYRTVCNDAELRGLGAEIDTELGRVMRGADPLTVLLLKRDQVFFANILGAGNLPGFQGQDDQVYARLLEALKTRRRTLAHLRIGGGASPEGSWSNVFANATIAKAAGGALSITLNAHLSYADQSYGEIECAATATAAPNKDGWYSATLNDKKDSEGGADVIRFRLQGNTLRIVHQPNSKNAVCSASERGISARHYSTDVLTGSFFPAGPAASASGNAPRAIAPSFDCAKAENADEEEICADPELAQADREIARIYGETLRRLDRKLAGYLRADQRAWASDNAPDFLANLQPGSDKEQSTVHHTSRARRHLMLRQKERILLLANLDEKRKGLEGYWLGYDSALSIAPAEGKSAGTLRARGTKRDVEDYKARCDFTSDGKIENGAFKADDEFPKLTRDGGTLLVDAEDADKGERPGYCWRMPSPKARLFPVKAGSGIEEIGKELR